MAEQRDWVSPYNFVQNNPINRIDPDGALDDYAINRNGDITLLRETDDNFDRLFAVNDNNEINQSAGSVTISKEDDGSSILSQLANNDITQIRSTGQDTTEEIDVDIAVTDESNRNDVFNVFKFAADNTDVEFSVGKINYPGLGTNYQIGTFHLDNLSPGIKNSKIGNPLGLIHSHPNQPTAQDRTESLFGDEFVGTSFIRKHGANTPYLIYFPDNKSTVRIVPPKNSSRRRGTSVPSNRSKF